MALAVRLSSTRTSSLQGTCEAMLINLSTGLLPHLLPLPRVLVVAVVVALAEEDLWNRSVLLCSKTLYCIICQVTVY